jgi:hypothetical protein
MRSVVQEYLRELNQDGLAILKSESRASNDNVNTIRFGTLEDGEVRQLNNSRWAIPIINVSQISGNTINRLVGLFPPSANAEFRVIDKDNGTHKEIHFDPRAATPDPYPSLALPPLRPYGSAPASTSNSAAKFMLGILCIIIVGSALYFASLYMVDLYNTIPLSQTATPQPSEPLSTTFPETCSHLDSQGFCNPHGKESANQPLTKSLNPTKPMPSEQPPGEGNAR